MSFIHHDKVGAFLASDSGPSGWFDVIEHDGSFKVYDSDGGMLLHSHETLDQAMKSAQKEASDFDRRKVEQLKSQWLIDRSWDIEDTEGFQSFKNELLIFRLTSERDRWRNEYLRLRTALDVLKEAMAA